MVLDKKVNRRRSMLTDHELVNILRAVDKLRRMMQDKPDFTSPDLDEFRKEINQIFNNALAGR